MTTEAQTIVAKVLALPLPVREEVLTQLIKSIDTEEEPTLEARAEAEAAWKTEIERRVKEVEQDQADLLDGDNALSELRKKFGI